MKPFSKIIKLWSSEELPNTLNYNIICRLISTYDSFINIKLINLYKLNKLNKNDNDMWYLDNVSKKLYNISIVICDNTQSKHLEHINKILKRLNIDECIRIVFYLEPIKRNQVCNITNVINYISVANDINRPEYYVIKNVEVDNISLTETVKNTKNIIKKSGKNKRHTNNDTKPNKKHKTDIDWTEMVSASTTRNYVLNDPIIDWIKEYNISSIYDKPNVIMRKKNIINKSDEPFVEFIMNQGNLFEKALICELRKKHKIITVTETYQSTNVEMFNLTLKYINEGHPIIYQGVLHNYDNMTYGAPDLLIRNDYINKFIGYDIYDDCCISSKRKIKWHYVVVDIKHSLIHLANDTIHIRNSDNVPAYKSQLYIYTTALNNILGTNVTKAFIMGKKYKCDNYVQYDYMHKMGTIDYADYDYNYSEKTDKALAWIRDVRKKGMNWSLYPKPSKVELYPNMKKENEGIVGTIKKDLAEKICEITSICYCGLDKRMNAFEQGIYRWDDKRCNANILGFNEGIIGQRVDKILSINRNNKHLVLPKKILLGGWRKLLPYQMEFYLDFETICNNFGEILPNMNDFTFIFMIGVGHCDIKKLWNFKSFTAKERTLKEEENILNEFWKHINMTLKKYNKKEAIFVHWTHAEKTTYMKAQQRIGQMSKGLPNMKTLDLYQIFIEEPIVVKGALKYSLKSIAKALYKNKLINTTWETSECNNGMNAMLLAHKYYNMSKKDNIIMKDIIKYNEIDCKCLWEIIKYLRENH